MSPDKFFIAEVRDHDGDPWKSGRVRLRVYGKHDNEQDIKDEDLPWGLPLQNITSAATNRVGTSPTGVLTGSRVFGVWLDEAQQYPIILGTFARAGKLKDEDDNTGGKDDIDEKYSDVPLAAMGKKKHSTQAKKTVGKQKEDPKKKSKYNKKDYVSEQDAEDPLEKSREKNAKKSGDLPTLASLDKNQSGNILEKILQVDSNNSSGALQQAPRMFQQIMQISGSMSGGGINGMAGSAMGGSLQGLAGNLGLGNIVGMLSGMLGGMMSGGGGGGQGGGNNFSGANGYPSTPGEVGLVASDLLNMLGGFSTPSSEIGGMSVEDRETLYTALLQLMNSVVVLDDDKTTRIYMSETRSRLVERAIAPLYQNQIVSQTSSTVVLKDLTLPGTLVAESQVPVGYIQVFHFTDVDPWPGYIEWEGPNGERLFTERPADRPYVATPAEDAINSGIMAITARLLELVRQGKLTLNALLEILGLARTTVSDTATQNALGNGMQKSNNRMQQQMLQQLLGMLGQLIQQAQTMHLQNQDNVLDKQKMNEALEKYSKRGMILRQKKKLAKEAVSQKNQTQNVSDSNMIGFGSTTQDGSFSLGFFPQKGE